MTDAVNPVAIQGGSPNPFFPTQGNFGAFQNQFMHNWPQMGQGGPVWNWLHGGAPQTPQAPQPQPQGAPPNTWEEWFMRYAHAQPGAPQQPQSNPWRDLIMRYGHPPAVSTNPQPMPVRNPWQDLWMQPRPVNQLYNWSAMNPVGVTYTDPSQGQIVTGA